MPSRIDIGPETGPFVELDEENGEFVIRVPEDEVNFDQSDLRNVKDFTAGSVSTDELNNTTVYLDSPVSQTDIEAAENKLPGGGEIVLPEGVHEDRFGIGADDITLRGRSKNAVLKLPDGTDEPAQVLTIEGENVTVENLTIDGNKNNQDMSSGDFGAADGIGIYTSGTTVRDVVVKKAMAHGIIAWGEDDSWNDSRHEAANIGVSFEEITEVDVDKCVLRDTGTDVESRAAIDYAYQTHDSRVTDTIVFGGDDTATGFTSHAGTGGHDNLTISGLKVFGTGAGINLRDGFNNGIVSNCTIVGHRGHGIYASSGIWEKSSFTSNTIKSSDPDANGFHIRNESDCGIVDSVITGNPIDVPGDAWDFNGDTLENVTRTENPGMERYDVDVPDRLRYLVGGDLQFDIRPNSVQMHNLVQFNGNAIRGVSEVSTNADPSTESPAGFIEFVSNDAPLDDLAIPYYEA